MNKLLEAIGISVGTVAGIVFIIGLLLLTPFVFLWCVNTLFSLNIAYSGTNILVALLLLICVWG